MLIQHILEKVEIPQFFKISISDAIEIDFSRLNNIDVINLDKIDVTTNGTIILSKKALTINYNPMPYYATDKISMIFVDSNGVVKEFVIPIVITDSITKGSGTSSTSGTSSGGTDTSSTSSGTSSSGSSTGSTTGTTGTTTGSSSGSTTGTTTGGTTGTGTSTDSGSTSSSGSGTSTSTGSDGTDTSSGSGIFKPYEPPKLPKFYKVIYDVYPEFVVDENTFWEKIIHNYKNAIWHKSREDFSPVWDAQNFGLDAIQITVGTDNIMKVVFKPALVEDLERLYPDNKL